MGTKGSPVSFGGSSHIASGSNGDDFVSAVLTSVKSSFPHSVEAQIHGVIV